MPVFNYSKTYRELIAGRVNELRGLMGKIEAVIGRAYLLGEKTTEKKNEWTRMNAEVKLLEEIQAAVVREHGSYSSSYKYAEW